MPVIPALGHKGRQEEHEFEVSLAYIVRSSFSLPCPALSPAKVSLDLATHRCFSCAAAAAAAAAVQQSSPGCLSCPINFDGAIRTHICKRVKHSIKIRKKVAERLCKHKAKNPKYIRKLCSGAGNTLKLLRWSRADAGMQGLVLSSWWDQVESRCRNHIPAWLFPPPTVC